MEITSHIEYERAVAADHPQLSASSRRIFARILAAQRCAACHQPMPIADRSLRSIGGQMFVFHTDCADQRPCRGARADRG
jgi:hypothetical protein